VKLAKNQTLEANTEYLLVLKVAEDLSGSDRVDLMVAGLTVEKSGASDEEIRYEGGNFGLVDPAITNFTEKGVSNISGSMNFDVLAERYDVNGWKLHSVKDGSVALFDGTRYVGGPALGAIDMVAGSYVAIQFKNPGTGSFPMSLSFYRESTTRVLFNAYVIPADTENIEEALTNDNLYYSGSMYQGLTQSNGSVITVGMKKLTSTEDAGDYLLVLKVTSLTGDVTTGRMYLKSFNVGDSAAATGDNTPVMLIGFIALVSLGAVCFLSKKRYAC